LLNAIQTAMEVEDESERSFRTRRQFAKVFGYDPSIAREEIVASIPQVLALMNAPQVNRLIVSRKSSQLKQLLLEVGDDEQLIVELYLRWLCRQPSDDEIAQAIAYCQLVGDRGEAFEDLQWALLNSAEFQHRR
jgi:hypothetical protein